MDLVLPTDSFHLLVGPNGGGKTTMLRLMATLTAPSSGAMRWTARDGTELDDPVAVRRRVAYAAHTPLVYDDLTVAENIDWFVRLRGRPSSLVSSAIERFGLTARAEDRVATLSRGLRQRVALAQVFAADAEVLLLDEPGSNLDEAGLALLLEELKRVRARATVVVATHDPDPFRPLADATLSVQDGSIQTFGGGR